MLHFALSFRSATEFYLWGMKQVGANRNGKMGAVFPLSAKLLIPQRE